MSAHVMQESISWAVLCLLLALAVVPTVGLAQDTPSCNAQDGAEVCITTFSISELVVEAGEKFTADLRIKNVGSADAEEVVLAAVA